MLSAGVAELVDALDLGSSDESCGGSSPSARTKRIQRLTNSGEPRSEGRIPLGNRFAEPPAQARSRAPTRLTMSALLGRTKPEEVDAMQVTETLAEGLKHEFSISVP